MPPDLEFPPGLGLERLSEQQKAKNPRRKANRRLARLEGGARAAAQAAAPVAEARPGADEAQQPAEAGPAETSVRAADQPAAAATGQPSSAARAQPGSSSDSPHTIGRRERQPRRAGGQSNGRRQSLDNSQAASGEREERPCRFAPHLAGPELQRALKLGRVLRCEFRVNAGDRKQGFAGLAGLPADIQIQGLEAQNRAFPGDQVAVEVLPQGQWLTQRVAALRSAKKALQGAPDNPNYAALEEVFKKLQTAPPINATVDAALQRTSSPEEAKRILTEKLQERPDLRAVGRVVAVLQPSFRRQHVVGVLTEPRSGWCALEPVDPRLPRGRVELAKLPDNVRAALQEPAVDGEWQLVSAIVQDWPQHCQNPTMTVRTSIGQSGEIEVETQAILEAEGVDSEDFGADVLACLPATPWSISEGELAARRDLRSVRTFTIDPPTARDLDDALSVEPLGDGRWRVGVHIADVSHFIPPGSALDAKAATRATTVYLVQRAVPMLPPLLCEQLCSLNPGVDRLAFSVMWVLDEGGTVHEQWTGRTVIRSCAKLAYRHAQDAIDRGCRVAEGEEPPVPLEAPHTWQQVVGDIDILHRISRRLHAARFAGGALRLDNVKLSFRLDADGNPASFEVYEQQEANELVAEFMLLANMSVAQLIGCAFPDKALLRRHEPPEDRRLGELETAAQKLGYDIDCSTAGSIQAGLRALRQRGEDPVILDILQLIATKPMVQAQYFATGAFPDAAQWAHFALAVPMYTHFTSPIRRYPDVCVHRLLAHLLATQPAAATRAFQPRPRLPGGLPSAGAGAGAEPEGSGGDSEAEEAALQAALEAVCEGGEDLEESEEFELLNVAADAEPEAGGRGKRRPPRVLAKKVGAGAQQPGSKQAGRGGGQSGGSVPVSERLLECAQLQAVAEHCNTRKTAAKLCSDASSRLHLCVMLRAAPLVAEAIVTVVNGSRFFDLYVPKLGLEARVQVAEIAPLAAAKWHAEDRVISIHAATSAPASSDLPCLEGLRNADKLANPHGLQPARLPLQVKAFTRLPVVLSAKSAGPAKRLTEFALLYLSAAPEGAAVASAEAAAPARAPVIGMQLSQQPAQPEASEQPEAPAPGAAAAADASSGKAAAVVRAEAAEPEAAEPAAAAAAAAVAEPEPKGAESASASAAATATAAAPAAEPQPEGAEPAPAAAGKAASAAAAGSAEAPGSSAEAAMQ